MDRIPQNSEELDELLSRPSAELIESLSQVSGHVIVLGVAGKMGPTLARMARRALDFAGRRDRIIGVARFSDLETERQLQSAGVETIRCDLLDRGAVARLPESSNVI